VQERSINERAVGAIGLGAMPMSLENRPKEAQSIATIHAAIDAGITLIDTADSYSISVEEHGHNERLVARALKMRPSDREQMFVATKAGQYRPGDGTWRRDGRPERIKSACEKSLRALEVDAIDLYQFHRPDPEVPYAESLGAFKELRDEGKVRLVGISNVTIAQIEEALSVVEIATVQNEFSPRYRSSEEELRHCEKRGIAFLPWSPLGGMRRAADLGSRHETFAEVASAHGVSPQRVALAWELALSPVVIPIPGATRPETITDSARAADLQLHPDDVQRLSR
jgi:aryl-alcohol dehydrogenase-like predicted oxidoreductase